MSEQPMVERRGGLVGLAFGSVGISLGLFASGVVGPDELKVPIVTTIALTAFVCAVGIGAKSRSVPLVLIGPFFLFIGLAALLGVDGDSPRWMSALIAGGMVLSAGGTVGYILIAGRREKELDRLVFSESTSIAHFVTMLGALTYALFESWLDVPQVSMWNVWTFGMLAWLISWALQRRRYS